MTEPTLDPAVTAARERAMRAARARSFVVIGVLSLLTAVLLVVFVLRLVQKEGAEVRLSPREFEVGRADRLSRRIDRDGPFLFKDPLTAGRGRELWLQHVGSDEETGWLAFEARPEGAAERCITTWDRRRRLFVDPCSDTTYPADGEGLVQYDASVDDATGIVVIDLRRNPGDADGPDSGESETTDRSG